MKSKLEHPHLSEHVSSVGLVATVEILTRAIHAAGMKLVSVIDHAASAARAGHRLPGTVVLLYGHSECEALLIRIAPSAALDLPLRILIREDGDRRTLVAFQPIVATLVNAGVPERMARQLESAQKLLSDALKP